MFGYPDPNALKKRKEKTCAAQKHCAFLGVKRSPCSVMSANQHYYDVVLTGKTGQGKSTLGNKLLDLENTGDSRITSFDGTGRKQFDTTDDVAQSRQAHSVTLKCKLLANEDSGMMFLDFLILVLHRKEEVSTKAT